MFNPCLWSCLFPSLNYWLLCSVSIVCVCVHCLYLCLCVGWMNINWTCQGYVCYTQSLSMVLSFFALMLSVPMACVLCLCPLSVSLSECRMNEYSLDVSSWTVIYISRWTKFTLGRPKYTKYSHQPAVKTKQLQPTL